MKSSGKKETNNSRDVNQYTNNSRDVNQYSGIDASDFNMVTSPVAISFKSSIQNYNNNNNNNSVFNLNMNNCGKAIDNSQNKLIEDLKTENQMLVEQAKAFAGREAGYSESIHKLTVQLDKYDFYKNRLEHFAEEAHSMAFVNAVQEQKIQELEVVICKLRSDLARSDKSKKHEQDISTLLKEKAEQESYFNEIYQQMNDQMSQLQTMAMGRIEMLEKELMEERHKSAEIQQKASQSNMKSARTMQQMLQQPQQSDMGISNSDKPTRKTSSTPPKRESSSRIAAKASSAKVNIMAHAVANQNQMIDNQNGMTRQQNYASDDYGGNDIDLWAGGRSDSGTQRQSSCSSSSRSGRRCSAVFPHTVTGTGTGTGTSMNDGCTGGSDVLMNIDD